jgi:hypothetical protein
MRLFISHKETDKALAKLLVNALIDGLPFQSREILCTSVAGHKLGHGETIDGQIKKEIQTRPILVALLSQSALKSSWVTFELGAAWGLDVLTIPILGNGVEYSNLPAAMKNYPCISMEQPASDVRASMLQAIEQIRTHAGIKKKVNSAKASSSLDEFLAAMAVAPPIDNDVVASHPALPIPGGYELVKTAVGALLFRSVNEPHHFVCTACWSKSNSLSYLQENGPEPTYATCPVCKHGYRLREDDTLIKIFSSPHKSTRGIADY